MSTGTFIITKAYARIGVYTVFNTPPPEAIIDGMTAMNGMLDRWRSKFIDLPFVNLDVPGGQLDEPVDATEAIIDNLAIQLSSSYSSGSLNLVSQELRTNARVGFNDLKKAYRCQPIPSFTLSSTTPVGQGNGDGLFNRRVFWGTDRTKGG